MVVPPVRTSDSRWPDKRQHLRKKLLAAAKSDFMTPPEVLVCDISRDGIGLSGIDRLGMRRTGSVQFYLPGSQAATSAICKICWFDAGSAGLKFIDFVDGAPQLDAWLASTGNTETPRDSLVHPTTDMPARLGADCVQELRRIMFSHPLAGSDVRTRIVGDSISDPYDCPVGYVGYLGKLSRQARHLFHKTRWLPLLGVVVLVLTAMYWRKPGASGLVSPIDTRAGRTVESSLGRAERGDTQATVTAAVEVEEGTPIYLTRPQAGQSAAKAGGARSAGQRLSAAFPTATLLSDREGEVRAVLLISDKGVVEDVRILDGDSFLADQVIASAHHWRYAPFQIGSAPVAVNLPVKVRFRKLAR